MDNRRAKFCLKILSHFGKIIRKPQGVKFFDAPCIRCIRGIQKWGWDVVTPLPIWDTLPYLAEVWGALFAIGTGHRPKMGFVDESLKIIQIYSTW